MGSKKTVAGDAAGNTLLWPNGINHELEESILSYTSRDTGWNDTRVFDGASRRIYKNAEGRSLRTVSEKGRDICQCS